MGNRVPGSSVAPTRWPSCPLRPRTCGSLPLARMLAGPTRDVVMIDADLEQVYSLDEVPADLAQGYARQADWDPRESDGQMRFLVLRPRRIQAWRAADGLAGGA